MGDSYRRDKILHIVVLAVFIGLSVSVSYLIFIRGVMSYQSIILGVMVFTLTDLFAVSFWWSYLKGNRRNREDFSVNLP